MLFQFETCYLFFYGFALDAFVREPEPFRDRATPGVLETRSDLDPVEAELVEPDVDQCPTGRVM